MDSHDIYEWMVVTAARVGWRIPAVDAALRQAIPYLAAAIPFVEEGADDAGFTHGVARAAYVHVVALGQQLVGAREDGAADTDIAFRAVLAVLDELRCHVADAERALGDVLGGQLPGFAA
jgi:hypothetical protein